MPFASTSTDTTTAANVIWRTWVTTTTGSTSTIPGMDTSVTTITAGSHDHIWQVWTGGTASTTSITTATDAVWANWVTVGSTSANWSSVRPAGQPVRSFHETPEMVAERERRAAEARRVQAAAERERAVAEERATQLLVSVLSEEQRRDFAAYGHFFVDAPSGRRYRIDKGRSGNVKVVDKAGQWSESLCIHQQDYVPVPDTMLMQKLLIETAEAEFRAVANITRRDGGSSYGRGLLNGERLAQVLPFPAREQAREAA